MTRVLIVGSLGAELGQAARIARARGARVAHAEGVTDALTRARNDGADLIMCDVAFDVGWLVGALAEERIASPLIACGLARDADGAARAIAAGARDFLPLPPEPDLIAAMIEAAAGTEEAPVHRDPLMTALMARAEQVARSEASLLVCGESGTGKEVLARHIHASSRRARGPFVAINCAALPEALLESELFGHEKGAFSGAIAARRGKFEQAEGGTLLLDEIGEMDPRLQAKLLRAIQEREVDRLGGTQPVRVDVRIIAATNRELRAEVAAGRFREDLFFRLNVIELRIPPLRERPGDILPLAERFAERYARANGLPARPFAVTAMAAMRAHAWPGNVRELENTIHRAVLLAAGDAIEAGDLDLARNGPAPRPMASVAADLPSAAPAAAQPIAALVGRRMEEVERDLIIETLSHCLGNRTRAAEILGISIRTLRNKLSEYRAAGLAVPPAAAAGAPYMLQEG